jgi:Peptidase propeptide and YPEB domain
MQIFLSALAGAALLAATVPALAAERPVTDAEREKLIAAVKAQGCSGGTMEYDEDDRQFEVDEAVCADGQKYDLEFNANFQLVKKSKSD